MSGYSAPHCGSLRASDEGRDVELYGWVARRRDMGGVIFIDLRDRWGKVQVVFNPAVAPAAHEAGGDQAGPRIRGSRLATSRSRRQTSKS